MGAPGGSAHGPEADHGSLAALGWLGLHRSCASGRRLGLIVGCATAAATTAFRLISFGMGILTLPIAIMMIAAAMTPRPGVSATT